MALSGTVTASLAAKGTARKRLLSAALTCKSFCPTALDILWRNMDNLVPLLKLLPSFQEFNGIFVIFGSITWADWVRFDCYARRVRQVTFREPSLPLKIHPSLYSTISFLHSQPVLPNLQSITYP
ncbi:hypothetical protein B0H19DRAFT_959324, partial [Mycena capillaripes]